MKIAGNLHGTTMDENVTELLARSINAGVALAIRNSQLVVRGSPVLRPLIDEIASCRDRIATTLTEAQVLLDETRSANHVIYAIGTNRVSASKSLPDNLRARLRVAKIPLIAILRATTPKATQASIDLTGKPPLSSVGYQRQAPGVAEYIALPPELPDDVLFVSQDLRLRWEARVTPFGESYWGSTFDTATPTAPPTLHCYYRVTPPVFLWFLDRWTDLVKRIQVHEWRLASDVTVEAGNHERLATEIVQLKGYRQPIEAALVDMQTYVISRYPDCNFDGIVAKLAEEPPNIASSWELNPGTVAPTPAWLQHGDSQIDFDLGRVADGGELEVKRDCLWLESVTPAMMPAAPLRLADNLAVSNPIAWLVEFKANVTKYSYQDIPPEMLRRIRLLKTALNKRTAA
jgi:hypothetical protein